MSAPDDRPAPEALSGRELRALDDIAEGFRVEAPKLATSLTNMKNMRRHVAMPRFLSSFGWLREAAMIGGPLHVARGICGLIPRCWGAVMAVAQMCATWFLYCTHLMVGKKWGPRRQLFRRASLSQILITSIALSALVFVVFILVECVCHQIIWWHAGRVGSHFRPTSNWTDIAGEVSLVSGSLTAIIWTALRHEPKK
jgi:hypothetical protein